MLSDTQKTNQLANGNDRRIYKPAKCGDTTMGLGDEKRGGLSALQRGPDGIGDGTYSAGLVDLFFFLLVVKLVFSYLEEGKFHWCFLFFSE